MICNQIYEAAMTCFIEFFEAHSRHDNWISLFSEAVSHQGVSRMVEKLNDMLKQRYGKGISIRRLAGIGNNLTEETSLRGEDLCIPIFVKDIFLGYGLVHEARDLSSEAQSQVARLVRMILEPHLYSQHLERTISNIEIEKSMQAEASNGTKTKGLYLFGSQASMVQKAALEIHEMTQNFCYLPFSDVAKEIHSTEDLKSIESSTLVVDLEKELNQEHQNLLTEFLNSSQTGPLIIFVGSKSASHLNLDNTFADTLKSLEFSVDRMPLDKTALNEVLEMLYFKS